MKQRYSICIFIAMVVIVAISAVFVQKNEKEEQLQQEAQNKDLIVSEGDSEQVISSSKFEENYKYIIFEVDGHLQVFYSDNQTMFFDTGILSNSLPDKLSNELDKGIRFQNDEELYEFLENYSS